MENNEILNDTKKEQVDEKKYVSFSKIDDNGNLTETIGYYESSDISDFLDEYFEKEEEIEQIRRK